MYSVFFLLIPPKMFKYGTGPTPQFSNWTPPTQNVIKLTPCNSEMTSQGGEKRNQISNLYSKESTKRQAWS